MFVQKILHRKQKLSDNQSHGYVPFLIIAIIIATIGIRLFTWINDGSNAPLLIHVDNMIQFTDSKDIPRYTKTVATIPTELYGASPYVIGVYPTDSTAFPANSIAIVFEKNNLRYMEMQVVPNQTLEQMKKQYGTFKQDSVLIHPDEPGLYVRLRQNEVSCKYPRDKSHPSFCPFTDILLFEHERTLIKLINDGGHFTDGELLMIARSIEKESNIDVK